MIEFISCFMSEATYSFDRENFKGLSKSKLLVGFLALSLVGGSAVMAASKSMSLGSNGIDLFTGTLDVNGNDIESGGTTVWDASNGYIPKSQLQNLVATDVGLGNVENENALAQDGSEKMKGDLDMGMYDIETTASDHSLGVQTTGQLRLETDTDQNSGGTHRVVLYEGGGLDLFSNNLKIGEDNKIQSGVNPNFIVPRVSSGGQYDGTDIISDEDMLLATDDSEGAIVLMSQPSTAQNECYLAPGTGDWVCDGSKSWSHSINSTHQAVYSSQESGDVRAVYEGEATVKDSKKIKLPSHFSRTVSDSKPMLRAQVTPQGTFTKAVVMDKTDDYIEIKVGKETDVDFRITGIREGYENRDIVRPQNKR
jgi:hypothetical protein